MKYLLIYLCILFQFSSYGTSEDYRSWCDESQRIKINNELRVLQKKVHLLQLAIQTSSLDLYEEFSQKINHFLADTYDPKFKQILKQKRKEIVLGNILSAKSKYCKQMLLLEKERQDFIESLEAEVHDTVFQ